MPSSYKRKYKRCKKSLRRCSKQRGLVNKTKKKLIAMAKKKGISGYSGLKKTQLINLVAKHR